MLLLLLGGLEALGGGEIGYRGYVGSGEKTRASHPVSPTDKKEGTHI